MARLTRVHQKVFASNASNNGVFGSLQAGNPTTSNDVATLQSLSAFENGWDDAAYSGDKLPPLEEFQGIQYGISYQQAYMLQEGIAEWEASTPYYKGSLAKTISGSSFKLYCSLADNNTGNVVTNTTYWRLVMDSDAGYFILNDNNTATGNNTFTGTNTYSNYIYRKGTFTLGTAPSAENYTFYGIIDQNNNPASNIGYRYLPSGAVGVGLSCRKQDGSNTFSNFYVGFDANGDPAVSASTGIKSAISNWGMPKYGSSISISNNTDYECPSDGYIYGSGTSSHSTASTIKVNGTTIMDGDPYGGAYVGCQFAICVRKGDTVRVNFTQEKRYLRFFPLNF